MPTPNPIRKEILHALDEHIIPALWRQQVSLGYVAPPLEFPSEIEARLISKTVPRATQANGFPIQTCWAKANLWSYFFPVFKFIYEGVAEERTLITATQAAKYNLDKGVYAIRWRAPSVLIFPSGTAHCTGSSVFWEDPETVPHMKILYLSVSPELLMHTRINDETRQHQSSHSLQINDPAILSLAELCMEELRSAHSGEQGSAQALLLSLMLRLQKRLRVDRPKIANTSRPPVPSAKSLPPSDRAVKMGREIALFIQMHLHEPLSLQIIAQKADISAVHVNRLFNRVYGMPVMHYVRTQRIAAAKRILILNPENITEVAQLVGFKRTNLFCRAFRHETGLTPGQFRRQAKRDKSTFNNKEGHN